MAKFVKADRDVMNVDEEIKKLEGKTKAKSKTVDKKKATTKREKKVTNKAKNKKGTFKFFKEVKNEMSKVKWPSKKDMIKYSVATILFIVFFATFFYVIDLIVALLKAGV